MFIDDLKKSILQKAIQGKLVEQNPNDEPACELLKRIRAEKEKLIKDGKIKKEKNLSPITDEEKPFDIPNSWEWVRLGEVSSFNGGFAFKSNEYVCEGKGIRVLRISDFNEYGLVNKSPVYIPYDEKLDGYKLSKGDIVMCMTGGTVGKSYLFNELDEEMYVNQRVADIKCNSILNINYIYTVILSNYIQSIINQSKNSTNDNISADLIKNFIIPLPPLEEQKRIVAKLDELMPLLDEARPLEEEITKLEKDFPSKLRQSILQYGIQGKLVSHNNTDTPASELFKEIKENKGKINKQYKIKKEETLAPIKDEEKPFDVPNSWEWVRLGNIVSILGDGIHGTPEYDINGEYYFVNGNNLVNGVIEIKSDTKKVNQSEFEKYKKDLNETTMFVSINGTLGNIAFYNDEKIILGKSACYFNLLDIGLKSYLYYLFKSKYFLDYANTTATGATIKNVSLGAMRNYPIPLPPLEEQKRIVAKLDELMKLCDELEEQIG